ncbi:MAG: ParB/RepB/Spo0J family partition protein [Spirochaetota bacterium]|nr:ParB/RepB/Spo0J family partition protein [Spirochaetota bacterium]
MPDFQVIPLDQIDFDNKKYSFRRGFEDNELPGSIESEGLIHPVVLQKAEADKYIIVSGFRRALACRYLGKSSVEAKVYESTDHSEEQLLRVAIAENTKRQNLEPIEIAQALLKLQETLSLSLKDLATQFGEVFGVGKSPKSVENYIKLNKLDDTVKDKISSGEIKPEIGFELSKIDLDEDRSEITRFVLDNDVNKSRLHEIIENAKKLKVDREMDSFQEVFQKSGLQDVLQNSNSPDRLDSFVKQLNKEANPVKAQLSDMIQDKIESIYRITQEENSQFSGKLMIKKRNVEKPGVNITLAINSVADLAAVIALLQGTGGKLLKEVIEPTLEHV